MKVIATIQSTITPDAEPKEFPYYTGDDAVQAAAALVMAHAQADRDEKFVRTLSIRIDY